MNWERHLILENQLNINMAKKKKNKKKAHKKTISKPIIKEDYSPKIKSEIKDLEEKRTKLGSGFRNTLRRMALNKQIHDKQNYLKSGEKIINVERTTELINKKEQLEQAKLKLKEAREKSKVNFDGFLGGTPKTIKIEDIFR